MSVECKLLIGFLTTVCFISLILLIVKEKRKWYNKIMKDIINTFISILGTTFVYIYGGFDVALQCLIIAIILDYLTGLIKSYINKSLSSSIGFKGILKKIGILILVALAVLVDKITGETGAIRTLVIYYFVANEGLSIIENLGEAGLPIPSNLKNALDSLKDKNN